MGIRPAVADSRGDLWAFTALLAILRGPVTGFLVAAFLVSPFFVAVLFVAAFFVAAFFVAAFFVFVAMLPLRSGYGEQEYTPLRSSSIAFP